jgi:hypothetical protein
MQGSAKDAILSIQARKWVVTLNGLPSRGNTQALAACFVFSFCGASAYLAGFAVWSMTSGEQVGRELASTRVPFSRYARWTFDETDSDNRPLGEKWASMSESLRHCVVVPVYNHGLTVAQVVQGAAQHFPVIVVNDGSTDNTTAALASLADKMSFEILTLPTNQGKANALMAAFKKAGESGYTHAVTVDADGQHPIEAIPLLAQASCDQAEALIIGVRDLRTARAPRERRFSNALSNFWFHVETGVPLADTQTGLRCYPLATVERLRLRTSGYAWELEILVRAAWAGVPLLERPVAVDYAAPTSRLSHFNPVGDFLRITRLHAWLVLQALVLPRSVRARRAVQPFVRNTKGCGS